MHRRGSLLAALSLWVRPGSAAPSVSPTHSWPRALPVPGGIARLALGAAAARPTAHDGEVPLLVVGDAGGWAVLVGIPLTAQPGTAHITVRQAPDGAARDIAYAIAPKRYSEQRLTVAPGKVDLSPGDQARYQREREHLAGVMSTFTEPAPQAMQMRVPVPGRRSGSFGLRRVFNGQPRNPHSASTSPGRACGRTASPANTACTKRVAGSGRREALSGNDVCLHTALDICTVKSLRRPDPCMQNFGSTTAPNPTACRPGCAISGSGCRRLGPAPRLARPVSATGR